MEQQSTLNASRPYGDPSRGATGDTAGDTAPTETLVADELLIEEISIDGMCGVY